MNEIRKYASYSNDQLEKTLQLLRNDIDMIENEKALRRRADKEKAWQKVVESIEDFCDEYGAITVTGEYSLEGVSIDIFAEDMDTSTIGLIEM